MLNNKICFPLRLLSLLVVAHFALIGLNGQERYIPLTDEECFVNQIEKIYVHLAKNPIVAGEELPFKAYLVKADKFSGENSSTVIYFEIIGPNGKIISAWRSYVSDDKASGKTIIPDTISSGIYTLQAYTHWMLNMGNSFVFQCPLIILNIGNTEKDYLPALFYKENSSISNNVSVNDTTFTIHPELSGNKLSINISCNENNTGPLRLITIQNGKVLFDEQLNSASQNISVSHTIEQQSPAQLYFLLTGNGNSFLAEGRLLPESFKGSRLIVEPDKQVYKAGEKIQLRLSAPAIASVERINLSCAVYEKPDTFLPMIKHPIDDYMLLYSDYVVQSWYNSMLEKKADSKKLTNLNWQYSIWNPNKYTDFKCIFPKETQNLLIAGRITDKYLNKSVPNAQIILSKQGNVPVIKYCYTNAEGEFYFWLDKSFDNCDLLIQFNKKELSNSDIMWEFYSSNNLMQNISVENINLTANSIKYLENIKQLSLIEQVYKPNKPEIIDNIYAQSGTISSEPNYTIIPSDYEQLENFKEISDNILPGVALKKRKEKWILQIYDPDEKMLMQSQSIVLLNGVPFSNYDYIAELPIDKIDRIDVYQSHIIYGELDFYGIVAIYTNDKILPQNFIINETRVLHNRSLASDTSIISVADNSNSFSPEFSRLIYWNPSIDIDNSNKVLLEFRASGYTGEYIVEIEGISTAGTPYSIKKTIIIE